MIGHNRDVAVMFTKPPEGNWIMKHIDTTTPSAEIDHSGNRPIVSELVGREEFSVVKSVYTDKFFGKFFLVQKKLCLYAGMVE